jgi:hypothetical protein
MIIATDADGDTGDTNVSESSRMSTKAAECFRKKPNISEISRTIPKEAEIDCR